MEKLYYPSILDESYSNKNIKIRNPEESDSQEFLVAMNKSIDMHQPWTTAPLDQNEYDKFLLKSRSDNNNSFLISYNNQIAGVININEMILGAFKSAFLGYFGVKDFSGQGIMQKGMVLVINYAFKQLGLHRLEANIQPKNIKSINLVRKLGFTKEGYSSKYLFIDGEWRDHERWAITIENWKSI